MWHLDGGIPQKPPERKKPGPTVRPGRSIPRLSPTRGFGLRGAAEPPFALALVNPGRVVVRAAGLVVDAPVLADVALDYAPPVGSRGPGGAR